MTVTVWSVGHSTLAFDAFVALLEGCAIEVLVDVRSVPKSRRSPHFHTDSLAAALPAHGIAYERIDELGGWRSPAAGSVNDGWRNRSFRGYADHARTPEFARGLQALRATAAGARTAMMCSEALWWRCHRRLVADRLVTAGDTVLHIGSGGRTAPHRLTPFAVPAGDGTLIYPATA